MAVAAKPSNEEIVKLIDQILSDLSELKSGQQELTADLSKVVKTIR